MTTKLKEVVLEDGLSFSAQVLDEIRLLNEAPDQTSITTRQAHLITGVAESTLEQWRCTKRVEIPYYRFGRAIRYRLADLRKFQDSCRVEADNV